LGNVVFLGGARKTPPSDDIAEHFKGLQVHGISLEMAIVLTPRINAKHHKLAEAAAYVN
jgi:hypothetical protein